MADKFVWYELMTTDPKAAADYYTHVVGWSAEAVDTTGEPYTLMKVGDRQVAGIMARPAEAQTMPPSWFGYIGVDDVDAAAEKLKAAGGQVHKGPGDIPNVGRFAVVVDPQGAAFMLFTGNGEAPPELPFMSPGTVGWHELHTSDIEAGLAFYNGQFGFEEESRLDMGPMGSYVLWKRAGAPNAVGGMVREDVTYWLYYFAVEDIDAATARLTDKGGTIMHGPVEVPGGAWITLARDPQGAVFAVVGMKTGAAA